jgi:AraC-like DNA-binding protein
MRATRGADDGDFDCDIISTRHGRALMSAMPLPSHEPPQPEGGAWNDVRNGWRLLYGGFASLGVSIERHEFFARREIDWARSFHPDSIELCLNFAGSGELRGGREKVEVRPQSAVAYAPGRGPLTARRLPGEAHHFLTIEMQPDFLARQVAGAEAALDPVVRGKRVVIGQPRPLTLAHEQLAARMAMPPVGPAALPLWFQSKVLELIAEFLFAPQTEMFCERQKRIAHERVERVKAVLRARLDAPPSLDELGREVGVSQFYLSRTFSAEVGMTIPQYLRRIRMERAGELLLAGTHNVTEAAFAVGYASLGHFSKSFCEVLGCCPTLYPHTRHLAKAR